MAELNMAAASEALKRWYLPGLQYQLNNSNPLLSVLERDSDSVAGEKIYMALRYGRQGGIGNRADDGRLPTPNSRKTKQASWDTKNIFARIRITDKTMRASRSNRGAFVSLLEADLDDALVDAKDSLNRQLFGDGSGKLATCTAQSAVTTLTVSSVQYLVEGMYVDILDNAGVVKVGSPDGVAVGGGQREILMVDDTTNQVGISGSAVTTLATDILTVAGSYNQELTGLGSIFTPDNTLYNVSRTANKWFNPTIVPVAGEISELLLQKGEDEVDKKAGGQTNFYVTSHGVRRSYQNLLMSLKRFADPMELVGGWKVLSYNGKPFTTDKYAPSGTVFGLDLSTFRFYQMMDWDWLDDDGAVLSRVTDKASWEATLARYCDIGCSKPRASFKMTGVVEH